MPNTTEPLELLRSASEPDATTALPHSAFSDLVVLAARLADAPFAAICLGSPVAHTLLAQHGLATLIDAGELISALPACPGAQPLVVDEVASDPAWQTQGLVRGAAAVRCAVGIPLRGAQDIALGSLWVFDRSPRRPEAAVIDALQRLARQAELQFRLAGQHAAEQALAAEQRLNRQIVAASPVGIAIYNRDGNCVTANEAFATHTGCTVAQALAQNFHRLAGWQENGIYPIAVRALSSGGRASGVIRAAGTDTGQTLLLSVDFLVLQSPSVGHLMMMTQDLTRFRQMEDARREMQERFEMLFVNSMDGILLGRPDGSVSAANPAACAMLGMAEQEIIERGREGVIDLGDPRLQRMVEERRLTGRTRGELRVIRGDGTRVETEISSVLYPDSQGRLLSSSIMRDITVRRSLEQRLQGSLDLLDRLAQRVPGVIYQYRLYPDGRSCFPFASEGIRSIYEVTPEEVREDASMVFARLHPDDIPGVVASIEASARTLQPWHHEYRVVLPKQGTRWRLGDAKPERLEDGSVLWHGFITDITQRRRQEEQTHWLAYFDSLTALPNRRLLLDRMGQALAHARRSGDKGCLLFVDLDHFKRINDARGHAIGDSLLQQVAQRLEGVVRAQDTVARLGGDEFVILVTELGEDAEGSARAAVTVAEKVRTALHPPYRIEGNDYTCHGSVGITLFPKGEESVDDLLREADTAMYRAKEGGRDGIAFFASTMQAEVEEALALENDLKVAIERGQLALHVQGQFDIDGHLSGAEVLLRWQHPARGMIPPSRFIPIAEDTGLIVPIGEWVLEQAALGLARLAAGGCQLSLSINLSPRQFRHQDFVERVQAILDRTGAPPQLLTFEVTERLLISDPECTVARMMALRALGVRFSLDDFGTEYASLRYLKKLPLHEIKIDRAFVDGLPDDANDASVVNAIVSMAQQFRLRVVAEGVETPAQAEYLLNARCDALQGFLLARPIPIGRWIGQRLGEPEPPGEPAAAAGTGTGTGTGTGQGLSTAPR